LSFEAPLAVLRERVRSRQLAGGDASEASVQVLESQWAAAQPLSPAEEALTVHVDTTRPVDWRCIAAARRWQHAGYNASCPGMKYSSTLVMTR
jgi:predicted kinase